MVNDFVTFLIYLFKNIMRFMYKGKRDFVIEVINRYLESFNILLTVDLL